MRVYFYNEQITTYVITTEGKLFNNKTQKWLKGQISKNGYLTYNISIDGEKKRLYAHRMVAETYLPKESNKTEVNHIDGKKLNNDVNNLEWVTSSENKNHAIKTGLRNNTLTTVYCFDQNKKLVCIYPSIADACEINHFNNSWLIEQLNRDIKTLSHGYYWSRVNNANFLTESRNGIGKPVGQFTIEGSLVQKFDSRNSAARITGYNKKRIGECCNGKINTYHGYVFKYLV